MSFTSTSLDRTQRRWGAVSLATIIIFLGVLAGRVAYINTALRPRFLEIISRQQRGHSVLPARRGMILDRCGRVVALSRRMPDVFVDPSLVDDVDGLAAELAVRLGIPASEIAGKIRRYRPNPVGPASSRFVVLARSVDEVTARAVRSMGRRAVGLVDRSHREYPLGGSMAHVLGWVGRDGSGMEGIELAYDEHLRGRDGRQVTIRDARRRPLRRSSLSFDRLESRSHVLESRSHGRASVPPVDGGHIVLTIDAEIQRIAVEALARALARFEAESGVVIVMSPTDGDVLAMVCLPSFDPNDPVGRPVGKSVPPTGGSVPHLRNRALTDPVEPGSAFKPIIACGALEEGFVSATERIYCHMGSHRFGRRLVRDTRPHGPLDIRGIITRSSNIGMGIIAERMGNEVLYETLGRFGFGRRTGIELPGESAGVVYPLHRWTSYSTTSVPMGYEVLVTPLQLVNAFAAIVNDGVLLKPRLVRQLLGPGGEVVESFDRPVILGRAVSTAVARYMARELLVSVVEEGGGWRAKTGPYRVLGKTGTAKLTYADRSGYEPGAYLSVFVGAAPVADPRVVVLAMVRRPNPAIGYYGGQVAAPVVGEILTGVLAYLEVPPDGWVAFSP